MKTSLSEMIYTTPLVIATSRLVGIELALDRVVHFRGLCRVIARPLLCRVWSDGQADVAGAAAAATAVSSPQRPTNPTNKW